MTKRTDQQTLSEGDVAPLASVLDDWPWTPIEVTCAACGATNQIHEHPPELIAEGIKWECNHCGAANHIGGPPPKIPLDALAAALGVLECGECHATFDPAVTDHEVGDGGVEFDCPACSVHNRLIAPVGETGAGSSEATA